jgi:dihydrofolate reductase
VLGRTYPIPLSAPWKDVLVLGADVARQLLRADLLDELRIHLVPLLLGAGTPLFDGEQAELILEGKPVTGTVTHLRFRVAKDPDRVQGAGS